MCLHVMTGGKADSKLVTGSELVVEVGFLHSITLKVLHLHPETGIAYASIVQDTTGVAPVDRLMKLVSIPCGHLKMCVVPDAEVAQLTAEALQVLYGAFQQSLMMFFDSLIDSAFAQFDLFRH